MIPGPVSKEEQLLWERKKCAAWGMTSYDLDPVSGTGQYQVKYRRFQQKELQIMCFVLKIAGKIGDEKDDSSLHHLLDNVKMFLCLFPLKAPVLNLPDDEY